VTVARSLDEVEVAPSVVTIGYFDGVHRGHQTIIGRAVRHADELGVRSAAVTFDRHPMEVVRPDVAPPLLQSLDDRVRSLLDQRVDLVLVLPFTRAFSELSPPDFVEHVLVERLRAVKVVVGTNFRFGHRAGGDVVALSDLGDQLGFATEAVTLLTLDGEPISSTQVREHLAAGDLAWVNRALGRDFTLVGEVVAGDGRGRTIGVPTANLAVGARAAVPANGVYAGMASLGDRTWPCVVNVGTRPTFDGAGRSVEAHLLDADVDLYGHELTIAFRSRLRDERRFDGPEALVAQIRADIAEARTHLTG
jgi:riboflavin kinase/FMN adenylyltransferase